ncbi:M24 family metallopeptidase [Rhodoligotrophos ferricapiens]|uniref:M24 family metallopeptidase n=1 Tax=Rhodoligotrophos ferricapiens TaxID=3069264 RepID=UPI00315D7659
MDYRDEVYFNSQPENEAPFTAEEFADRLTRLRRRMADAKIDMLYLMAPESMYYLSGYQNEWYQAQSPKQWPAASAIAVHVDHDHYILFDSEREAVLGRIFTRSVDTRYFPRNALRGSADFVAQELKREGWLNGTVGMEFWSYRPNRVISHQLEDAFVSAGARVVDGTHLLREQRWVKSPAEIACLKEAARIANIGMAAARETIGAGVSELDVYGEMVRAMARAGGENPGITMPVLSGTKTNALHGMSTRRKMQHGELVLVDLAGVFKRYHINMARTFSIGEPSAEVRELTSRIAHSMDLIRSILRPNLPVRDFNSTVMDYFQKEGLWERRGWVGGYEMGIAFPPDWVGNFVYDPLSDINADRVFEPGTAVNYENQFFMPAHQGQYFTIDSFLFEESAAHMLSEQPFELIVIE